MLYKIMPRRFDTQVALMCALLMLCTVPFYVFHEANEELEFIFETARSQTKVIAQNIAINSIEHILTRDYSSLENLLINSAKFPSISGIQITNVSGKVISDVVSNDGLLAEPRYSIESIDVPKEIKLKLIDDDEEQSIYVFSPIKSGIHIGWVKLNYSLSHAYQHEKERFIDYATDGVLLTFLMSMLLMLAMRHPVKLIGDAVEFAARLNDKKGEKLPEIKHSIEIEKLFAALNKTSLSLTEQDVVIKQGVTALEQLRDELEDKVKTRTTELEKANKKLLHLNNVKSEFVSIVSHELRTPLTAIKSFAEILEDDFDDIDVVTRQKYLSIINKESVRLGNLINDVLDLQKIDAGKMVWNIEQTDIRNLVSQTIELFKASYKEKGLELHLEIEESELFADVDSDKIKQVLSNLLSNAFKFTDKGIVTLGVKQTTQKATLLIISADEYICQFLESFANDLGIQSITCQSSDDALVFIEEKKHNVDILICDLVLPDMDGAELISSIRDLNEHLPIVVMNSSGDDSQLASLLNYNISYVLTKPFDPVDVTTKLTKIFESVKSENNDVPMVEIFIDDSGLGISVDAQGKVFERFHQVESFDTREKGGSGLGLAICKDIVEYHRGRIWVTSDSGSGSRFSFNLPLKRLKTKRIGEILVESGVATQESIDKALANQRWQ